MRGYRHLMSALSLDQVRDFLAKEFPQIDGAFRAVCGGPLGEIDERDLFDVDAGDRVWRRRKDDRCRSCERCAR